MTALDVHPAALDEDLGQPFRFASVMAGSFDVVGPRVASRQHVSRLGTAGDTLPSRYVSIETWMQANSPILWVRR